MAAGRRRVGSWLVLLLVFGAAGATGAARAAGPSAIALENALPGDPGWKLVQRATGAQLEAYASAASVNHGEAVQVHARADGAHTLTWAVYRMGWYDGAEGRKVATGGPVAVGPQPTPVAASATGLLACAWPATFTVQTAPAWTSGVHLVVLTRDDGLQTYAIFVVRDDARRGAAVFQASFTTYQAYNRWGGRSAYGGFAPEISYDRPFAEGDGSGQYFRWEHDFIRWAEARGYDLVYVTGLDMDRDPTLLDGQRIFLSVGHDEYWTRASREHLEAALAKGVNAAFLSSNAIYWHVRLEPSRADPARLRRTQVCYKTLSAEDPMVGTPLVTVTFRDPQLDWPENAVIGVMYSGWNDVAVPAMPWVVRNAAHWVYEGTGVKDGDAIPGIVGYEIDRVSDNGRSPAGLVVLARSPYPMADGNTGTQEAAVHVRPSGAFVFATGSNDFSWGLSRPGVVDARVQRMMENVLGRAGLAPTEVAPPSNPPGGSAAAGTTGSGGCASGGEGALGALGLVAVVEAVSRARRRRA
jgi:hypothetical protein